MSAENVFNSLDTTNSVVSIESWKNSVCRVCLEENDNLYNIFESSYDSYTPVSKLFDEFFSSTLTQGDGYPETVCPNCLEKAIKAVEFKKKFSKAFGTSVVEEHSDENVEQGLILIVQNDDGECFQYLVQNVKQEEIEEDETTNQIEESLNQSEEPINETEESLNQTEEPLNQTEESLNQTHESTGTLKTIDNINIESAVSGEKKCFCQNCGISFFTLPALTLHMKSCFQCQVCKATQTNLADLKIHKAMHKRARETLCPECGDILRHGYHSLDNFKYPCSICKYVFPCTLFLKQHLKNEHKNGQMKNCKLKNREDYKKKQNIKISTNSMGYKCNHCDKIFNTLYRANMHAMAMNCMYVCDICGIVYKLKSQLKLHMMDKHLKVRPFLCCVCGKRFVKKGLLISHQQVHKQEKNFHCDVCHKKFVSVATLRYHSRLHTGERPYVCMICGEGFVKCSRLREHEQKWHIGKLQCPVCLTTFSQRCSLKTHMDRFHPNTYDRKCNYLQNQNQPEYLNQPAIQNLVEQNGFISSSLGPIIAIQIIE